jgi:Trypsin-like peptidase domain
VAMANYEVSPPNDPAGRPAVMLLDPALMFVTNADLDFTFCGVRGLEFLGVVPLDRERMHIAAGETVTIIQHPRGRPKEISLRDNRVVRADAIVVQYACDTEPGSSGSPVFNDQWKPVAIHHATVLTDSPDGRRVGGGSRARYLNEGIRLSAIARWLETAEANTLVDRERIERLRTLFGGLNPRTGFFGALGRQTHGRPATEGVAETFLDRLEVLDIGFWDTRSLDDVPGGLRDRTADLSQVIAEFGLDVWCLSQADPAALDALCERLWTAHGLSYQPIPIGGPCGVLFRPSKTLNAEPVADFDSGAPARVRIRARTRYGGEAEFQILPLASGSPSTTGLAELVHSIRRDAPVAGPDWILLADAGSACAPDGLAPIAASGGQLLVASDTNDGALVLVPGAASPIDQLFVSPNLKPALDPGSRLVVAHDRSLPASLHALKGPQPIALRVTLDRPEHAPRRTPSPPSLLELPSLPRLTGSLDDLIEGKLRDLIEPVISRLLASAGNSGGS